MTDVVFVFEVHQPFRIGKDYFWEHKMFRRLRKDELFHYYFDDNLNRAMFEKAREKCYLPANRLILDLIDQYRHEKKKVKVSYSVSGIFIEQCERFGKDVLEYFKQLAETGCVEFLDQTYHHSLCGLYPVKDEFTEQVNLHRQAMKDLFNFEPVVFENTELLYNNEIAKAVEDLGYIGIYTEGVERILKDMPPNHVYRAKNCKKLRVLLRNYKLTDDIGFRFSAMWWPEWPLTAGKYAYWLAATPGQCINIFPDYETFGEHHWPETGIHKFLVELLPRILEHKHLSMATPSEVIRKCEPVGHVDIPDLSTISWSGLERDTSCWLGNTMQWAYYTTVRDMEPLVKESQDPDFIQTWRYLQISDHLYYMYTAGGAPGEVHSYFNPYKKPVDAFVTCQGALTDFDVRLRLFTVAATEPFKFYFGAGENEYTGVNAWSLKGFIKAASKVNIESIGFHNSRGDFERWVKFSLGNAEFAEELQKIRGSGLEGEDLRAAIVKTANRHFSELNEKGRVLGYY